MKIGIITLSASDNCGSLLQTYALKKVLEKYGSVEVINFSSKESHEMYDTPRYRGMKKIRYNKMIKNLNRGSNDYKLFRREYIGITGKEYLIEDLKEINDYYDVVVVGSDQVWNVQMYDFSDAFFLGWAKSKKVAYAPSLGGRHLSISGNFTKIIEWLSDFSYISVREEIGKKCLEEVTGREVPKVLDPTLLLGEDEWNQIVGKPLIHEDYIFYYSWAYCEESTSQIVSDISRRLDLPVYVIDPRKWISKDPGRWNFRLYERTGPLVFLNLMKYAKRCYVESFHGMVFAYIFKKNYWLLDTSENIKDLDSRLMEFVNLLGAEERILTKYNVSTVDHNSNVVFKNEEILSGLKLESWKYLNQAFEVEES